MSKERKKMQRGAVRTGRSVFIGGWVPTEIAEAVDRAVQDHDSDRSKFLRRALQEKISRLETAA